MNLTCPHCGSKLYVTLETEGSAYMHYEVPGSIDCDGYCEAVWEPDGTARDAPKWERYPDLYEPPPT